MVTLGQATGRLQGLLSVRAHEEAWRRVLFGCEGCFVKQQIWRHHLDVHTY